MSYFLRKSSEKEFQPNFWGGSCDRDEGQRSNLYPSKMFPTPIHYNCQSYFDRPSAYIKRDIVA